MAGKKGEMNPPPLIVTLRLQQDQQQFFNELRKQHFPAHVNYLDAHITLFHHLPSDGPFIHEQLAAFANHPPIRLLVNEIRHLGNGVAYSIESEQLLQLHRDMQHTFAIWLNARDQQPLWPHITIQNKTTAFKAQQLFEKLSGNFTPFEITATGFNTWLYLKGPWKAVETFPFMDAHL